MVKDRKVNRTAIPATTIVDPGIYPMLWVRSATAKEWSHFWLPKENSAFPRPRKFERCTLVPSSERTGFPEHVQSAIRCSGAAPMYFAMLRGGDGRVGVQQALVPKSGAIPAWSSVPADTDDPWPAACAQMDDPEVAEAIYFRDTEGMRTYP